MDRGPDTLDIYRLFQKLTKQAVLEGGRVVQVLCPSSILHQYIIGFYIQNIDSLCLYILKSYWEIMKL